MVLVRGRSGGRQFVLLGSFKLSFVFIQQSVGASVHVVVAMRAVFDIIMMNVWRPNIVSFVQVKGGCGPGPVFQAVWFPAQDGGP